MDTTMTPFFSTLLRYCLAVGLVVFAITLTVYLTYCVLTILAEIRRWAQSRKSARCPVDYWDRAAEQLRNAAADAGLPLTRELSVAELRNLPGCERWSDQQLAAALAVALVGQPNT
jgi:hypothetical protein